MNSDLSMYRVREKEKSEWLCDENERENFTDKLLLLLLHITAYGCECETVHRSRYIWHNANFIYELVSYVYQ